jgi:predicted MFS family arabinose efflux permease
MTGARLRLAATPPHEVRSYLGSIREGFGYAWRQRQVRTPLLQIAIGSLASYTHLVLLPVFAAKTFGGDVRLLGSMVSSVGIGAIAGSLALASRVGIAGLERMSRASALGLAAVMCLFAASTSLTFSLALLTLAGFLMVNHMSASTALLQSQLPTRLRTRVMSIHTMVHTGLTPVGALLTGYIAETQGAATAVAVSAGMLAVGIGLLAALTGRSSAVALVPDEGTAEAEQSERLAIAKRH